MKRLLLAAVLLLGGCHKKEDPKAPAPAPSQPVQTGDLTIHVNAYDSLGGVGDPSNIKVMLAPGTQSALTGKTGVTTFTGLTYGDYYPTLVRSDGESAPLFVTVNSVSQTTAIPFAQISTYSLTSLQGSITGPDSIGLTFQLSAPLPSGRFCRLAVITSTAASLGVNSYNTVDVITTVSANGSANIAHLPGVESMVNDLPTGAAFYVNAIPLSYGLFTSNLTGKTTLLGATRKISPNLTFYKNW